MALTEKRPLDETVYSSKHIVLDIEGTTTSISFVKDTLFPYVRKNLDGYLDAHWKEDEFKSVLELLRNQAIEDKKADMAGTIEIPSEGSDEDVKAAVAKNVLWQMDADRKTTALKKLQGQMWLKGYKNGELKGHLFADVAPSLREWVKDGRKLYVYSSGSVEAQKLLFGNSIEGDLTELFTDFFDTQVGAKVDTESYKSIVKKLDCSADDVLFLTDLPKEASAARGAGLPVILVERDGNEPVPSDLRKEFPAVTSFQEVTFETTSKKQKVETDSVGEKEVDSKPVDIKPADESSAEMEVDSVAEEALKEKEDVAEAMDVDKNVEESTPKETVSGKELELKAQDSEIKKEENGTADEKAEIKDTESSSQVNIEVPVATQLKDEAKSEKAITEEVKQIDAEISETVKETKVTEKTDEAPLKKTEEVEEKGTEKVETESKEALPKDDTKTEEAENKSDALVEEKDSTAAEKTGKEDEKVSEIVESKTVQEASKAVEKNTTLEVAEDKDKSAKAEKEGEVSETKEIPSETELVKETNETEDSKSAETEEKIVPEKLEEKADVKGTNGTEEKLENGEGKEKSNGTTNGTNGTSNGTSNGTNGAVENGHIEGGKGEVPEVIVAKTPSQIENGKADASVVVEA